MSDKIPPHQMQASIENILETVGKLLAAGHSIHAIAKMTDEELAQAIDAVWARK